MRGTRDRRPGGRSSRSARGGASRDKPPHGRSTYGNSPPGESRQGKSPPAEPRQGKSSPAESRRGNSAPGESRQGKSPGELRRMPAGHRGRPSPSRPPRPPHPLRPPRRAPAPAPSVAAASDPAPRAGARLAEIDELELAIEKLVAGGDGIGRFEGIPIFVPRSAPGDRVRVRLVERRPGYGRAEIVEILAPGPGRREPPCPHFGVCGGCDLQHIEDRLQTRLKAEALEETLRRLSGLTLPRPRAVLAAESWAYRLRTQVHTRRVGDGIQVGYHQRRSRELVAVRVCPILQPELEREVVTLARRLPPEAPARLDLTLGDDGRLSTAPPVPGLEQGEITRRVAGFDYTFDARCFFQGHAGLVDALVDAVVGEEEGELAIDLYGGVGLFALPLARRYRRVVTVEGDRVASRFARRNVRANRAAAIEAVNQAVETWVGSGLPDGADRVVVDPPRDGLSGTVRALLAARTPQRLTYVSCHPAALARDLRELAGRFEVESLVLVDLFPQTGHMETVAQLVARNAERPE